MTQTMTQLMTQTMTQSILSLAEIKDMLKHCHYNKSTKYDTILVSLFNNGILDIYDFTDSNILNIFGLYYYMDNLDHYQTKDYFLQAIEKNNIDAMNNMAIYYHYIKDITTEQPILEDIPLAYENAVKYYKMAIDNGDFLANARLAEFYNYNDSDYELMLKYYLIAIENNDKTSMYNLAEYYKYKNNYDDMLKYYIMGEYYYDIAMFYYKRNNERMELYLIEGIKKDCKYSYELLQTYFNNNKLNIYNFLIKINMVNDLITNILKNLEKSHLIKTYKNKIVVATYTNNIKNCIICYNDNLSITLPICNHEICIDCYCKVKKCYYNCSCK